MSANPHQIHLHARKNIDQIKTKTVKKRPVILILLGLTLPFAVYGLFWHNLPLLALAGIMVSVILYAILRKGTQEKKLPSFNFGTFFGAAIMTFMAFGLMRHSPLSGLIGLFVALYYGMVIIRKPKFTSKRKNKF